MSRSLLCVDYPAWHFTVVATMILHIEAVTITVITIIATTSIIIIIIVIIIIIIFNMSDHCGLDGRWYT